MVCFPACLGISANRPLPRASLSGYPTTLLRRWFALWAVIAVVGPGFAAVARAEVLTFNYTGIATGTSGVFGESDANVGAIVTGFYTFDTAKIVVSPYETAYSTSTATSTDFEISVTLGGVTRTTANNSNRTLGSNHHTITWTDGDYWQGYDDKFQYKSSPNYSNGDDYGLVYIHDQGTSADLADGIAVGSGNLSSALIEAAPDVSLFNNTSGLSRYEAWGDTWIDGSVDFTVTSITPAAVPEPSTLATLVGMAAVALLVSHRRRKRA